MLEARVGDILTDKSRLFQTICQETEKALSTNLLLWKNRPIVQINWWPNGDCVVLVHCRQRQQSLEVLRASVDMDGQWTMLYINSDNNTLYCTC